jgi:adenine phosphoribosyltransferase
VSGRSSAAASGPERPPAPQPRPSAGRGGRTPPAALGRERTAAARSDLAERVGAILRDVPDFPKPGIVFKDLTPLLADGALFAEVAHAIADEHADSGFDVVAGVEARGFLFGAAVALVAGTGIVPVRKAGKLPWRTVTAAYELEYGEAVVEVHEDAFAGHRRVLLVDDVLATGGTLAAAADLVARAGGEVAGVSVVVELTALGGRDRLAQLDVRTVLAG